VLLLCYITLSQAQSNVTDNNLVTKLTETSVSSSTPFTAETITDSTANIDSRDDGQMTTLLFISIITCGAVSLLLLVLVGTCVWHKTSRARKMDSFLKVLTDQPDESMLYMVDYDDVAIAHGRLQMDVNDGPILKSKK